MLIFFTKVGFFIQGCEFFESEYLYVLQSAVKQGLVVGALPA